MLQAHRVITVDSGLMTEYLCEANAFAAESYGVREGSPVEVQWTVRWVEEDLWWEGFVEQVSFKSGMEERGSDGGDR